MAHVAFHMQRVEMIPGRAGAKGKRICLGRLRGGRVPWEKGSVQGQRSLSWQTPGLVGAMAEPGWAGAIASNLLEKMKS